MYRLHAERRVYDTNDTNLISGRVDSAYADDKFFSRRRQNSSTRALYTKRMRVGTSFFNVILKKKKTVPAHTLSEKEHNSSRSVIITRGRRKGHAENLMTGCAARPKELCVFR